DYKAHVRGFVIPVDRTELHIADVHVGIAGDDGEEDVVPIVLELRDVIPEVRLAGALKPKLQILVHLRVVHPAAVVSTRIIRAHRPEINEHAVETRWGRGGPAHPRLR